MHRYFVTGTDTDVGKTRITAALALALSRSGRDATVVKLVQTGLAPGEIGDAARAAALNGANSLELVRFRKPADPWSAALAQRETPPRACDLARALDRIEGAVVVEGAGGLMVPLNEREDFCDVVAAAGLRTILVVGLRLGCLNHALLTVARLREERLPIAGAVLVDRFGASEPEYVADVLRTLQGKIEILGILPFDPDEAASVREGARLFNTLLQGT